MLVKLMRNTYQGGVGVNSQLFCKDLIKILTGTATATNQLNSTIFNLADCSFTEGSYGTPTYWTVVSDQTSSSTSGKVILSKASTVSKLSYIQFSYTASALSFDTGNAYNVGTTSLSNVVSYTMSTLPHTLMLKPIYIRFDSTGFVHIWSPDFTYASSLHSNQAAKVNIAAVPVNLHPYDTYSTEGSIKLFSSAGYSTTRICNLSISNKYNPVNNTYTSTAIIARPYNIDLADLPYIGYGKNTDLTQNRYLLIPLIFRDNLTGWIGGDISSLTGIYASTPGILIGDETAVVDSQSYKVINTNTYDINSVSYKETLLARI